MKRFLLALAMLFALVVPASADYYGSWKVGDALTFHAVTSAGTTGLAADADAVPSYRIYEDETGTAIVTGTMAKLDDANTLGYYSEQVTLSSGSGFEKGKSYTIYISYAVSSNTKVLQHHFQIEAEVDANHISDEAVLLNTVLGHSYSTYLEVGTGKTYSTIALAKAAASPDSNQCIVVYPGSYTVTDEIGVSGTDMFFCAGAAVTVNINTSTAPGLLCDLDSGDGHGSVYGYGDFTVVHTSWPKIISDTSQDGTTFVFQAHNVSAVSGTLFNVASDNAIQVKVDKAVCASLNTGLGSFWMDIDRVTASSHIASLGAVYLKTKKATTTGVNILNTGSVSGVCILDGFFESTSSSSNGISASSGQVVFCTNGGISVPTGRPPLTGVGTLLVNDSFAYDTTTSTASAVKYTRGLNIMSRLPATLSSGRMRSDAEAISGDSSDADNLEGLCEKLGQLYYRLGIDGTTATPATNRPHLEGSYVRP